LTIAMLIVGIVVAGFLKSPKDTLKRVRKVPELASDFVISARLHIKRLKTAALAPEVVEPDLRAFYFQMDKKLEGKMAEKVRKKEAPIKLTERGEESPAESDMPLHGPAEFPPGYFEEEEEDEDDDEKPGKPGEEPDELGEVKSLEVQEELAETFGEDVVQALVQFGVAAQFEAEPEVGEIEESEVPAEPRRGRGPKKPKKPEIPEIPEVSMEPETPTWTEQFGDGFSVVMYIINTFVNPISSQFPSEQTEAPDTGITTDIVLDTSEADPFREEKKSDWGWDEEGEEAPSVSLEEPEKDEEIEVSIQVDISPEPSKPEKPEKHDKPDDDVFTSPAEPESSESAEEFSDDYPIPSATINEITDFSTPQSSGQTEEETEDIASDILSDDDDEDDDDFEYTTHKNQGQFIKDNKDSPLDKKEIIEEAQSQFKTNGHSNIEDPDYEQFNGYYNGD
jgi:hypothetical protein